MRERTGQHTLDQASRRAQRLTPLRRPLHAERVQLGDAISGEAVSAAPGVVDPLPKAHQVSVQDLDVPLGDVEVAFAGAEVAGGGQGPPKGTLACRRPARGS